MKITPLVIGLLSITCLACLTGCGTKQQILLAKAEAVKDPLLARADFEQAYKLNPDSEYGKRAERHIQDIDRAIKVQQQALLDKAGHEANPQHANAYLAQAYNLDPYSDLGKEALRRISEQVKRAHGAPKPTTATAPPDS